MNILFFYRIYPEYGGVEVVTTVLANRFTQDGHNVVIASIEQPHMELADKLEKGIDIVKFEYPITNKSNIHQLHSLIVDRNIDLIINQWGLPYKTTKLCNSAIKGTKCKLISVLHGSPYTSKVIIKAKDRYEKASNIITKAFYWGILKMKEEVIKYSIRYATSHNEKYILLSNSFIQPLINYARIHNTNNIIAIGNPITIPVNLNNFSLENKKKQILYAGRMDFENKRVNRILEAWKTIANDYLDWELILVGDGPHKKELIEIVRRESIPRVIFKGFQKEAPINFYKDASIYMLTSDLEGFGLVIIESMSYGVVPIVYGSYEAVYDIIDNGVNGFITPQPYSNNNTVNCLRTLIENRVQREEMAKSAMLKAKYFSVDSVIKQWYNLFDSL